MTIPTEISLSLLRIKAQVYRSDSTKYAQLASTTRESRNELIYELEAQCLERVSDELYKIIETHEGLGPN